MVLVITAFMVVHTETRAADLTLAWDAPTLNTDGSSLTNLVGYRVHYGLASGEYSEYVDVGNLTQTVVPGLQDGVRHYFVVTAISADALESNPSEEFVWDAPVPVAPTLIVTPPASLTVAEPASAMFSVNATGDGLTYQWRRNGQPISGATAMSYVLTTTDAAADNGATFSVVVTGDGGAVTSLVATLTVLDTTLPVISMPTTFTLTAQANGQASTPDLVALATITDNCSPAHAITVKQAPLAATLLPIGQTTVVITATDEAGNSGQQTITVTVLPPPRPRPPQNLHRIP